jgi:uncharacterized protein YkwD
MNRRLTASLGVMVALAGYLAIPGRAVADYRSYIIQRTDAARAQHRVPPLRPHPRLHRAAEYHARRMAARATMAHVLDGQDPGQRLAAAGYPWRTYGENVAWSQGVGDPARTAMDGWLRSPGHRANILGRHFTEIGVGWARSRDGADYFCQVFGAR